MKIILLILCVILIFSACTSKKEMQKNNSSNITVSASSKQEGKTESLISQPNISSEESKSPPVTSEYDNVSLESNTDNTSSQISTSSEKEEVSKPTLVVSSTTETEPVKIYATAADTKKVSMKITEYINRFRETEGVSKATVLPGLTAYAEYRSKQLVSNFAHDTNDERAAATALKYGEYVDTKAYGMSGEPYYTANAREAIGKGSLFGTAEQVAERIASGFRNSKGHWCYVGGDEYKYIAVGITCENDYWYCDIAMSRTNTDN